MADPIAPDPNLPLSGTTGFSDEDRQEILLRIEGVASSNRIQAGPELYAVLARKRGLIVPLLVNLGAVVVLAAGLTALYFLFRQGEETQAKNTVVVQSTEGKLLEALKKEAETQLLAKDKEIADIQKQMASLNKERDDLRSNMDAKVASKEVELRQKLESELAAERKRLQDAGFSQAKIDQKLKEFEKQKNAEFQKELAGYQKKAEAERLALESSLKKQQADFQKNADELEASRRKILSESKQQQTDLQAQVDLKNRELLALKATATQEIGAAQNELTRLNDQRAKTESAQNQISGLLRQVSQSIQDRRYPEGLKALGTLTALLNQESFRSLPDLERRRDSDLYLANALIDLLGREQKRLEDESAKVSGSSGTVEAIQAAVTQADLALGQGKSAEAEIAYKKALSLLPAVLAAHEYFLNQGIQSEKARQKTMTETLRLADEALAADKPTEALALYGRALEYLPLPADKRDALVDSFSKAANGNLAKKTDKQLQASVAQAQALLKQGKASEALVAYGQILEQAPLGKTGTQVVQGLRQASAGLQSGPAVSALQSDLEAAKAELTRVQKSADQSMRDKIALEKDLLSLQDQLTEARSERDAAVKKAKAPGAKADSESLAKIAALELQIASLKATRAEKAGAKPDKNAKDEPVEPAPPAVDQTFLDLQAIFGNYAKNDDALDKTQSSEVLQARTFLNSFLEAPEVTKVFPDLARRIQANDKAIQDNIAKETLLNVNEAVENLVQLGSLAEKKGYIDSLMRRYSQDPAMTAFLTNLRKTF